jgi:signal transduction histidine kinase
MVGETLPHAAIVGRPDRPAFGLAAKVLAPITALTLLSAMLGGLILREEYKSYQANVAQKKGELAWHARTLYEGNRIKLQDVANLLAENANVQNGLLIGDQYNPLNTIMSFLGHSGIDVINLYDLDGRAFARAQSPSYFGDYDEFAPLVRSAVAVRQGGATGEPISGVALYQGKPTLVALRVAHGVSGATGVVVVGQTVSPAFLGGFVPAHHTAIALARHDSLLVTTERDRGGWASDAIPIHEERAIAGGLPFEVSLLTDDPALFGPFWGSRVSILSLASIAGISSVIVTFIFMFMTVVRPVRHLIAVAEQQVSGDLSARARLRSHDELGRLGDILNVLTGDLKATLDNQDRIIAERSRAYESLKKGKEEVRQLNEQLEARVAQRTKELQFELSERERAQAALVRAKEEAEAANASKSRFLAAASHDLRQPVHAMTLFVSNLAQQVEGAKARKTVTNVNACVESLCEMFEKILDVSKLASGVIKPQIEDFPIDRLFGRLQREFEGLAAEKGIEFRLVRSTLVLKSDPALLYRILSNLLSNALKNTKQGRVLIGCRLRGEEAEIQIWDTGIGISQSEIVHIFEEFYRGTNRQDQKGGLGFGAGLGLGLSIVEHTAKLLHHAVHVSSTPNKRTRFSVTIPRQVSMADAASQQAASGASLDISGARVLVVDDDLLALNAVQSTLEGWGCVVAAAQSSDEALRILAHDEQPQVLIVDYLLQNGDTGVNLLGRAKSCLGIQIPSIVLSGVSSRLLEREVEQCGYELLYKPTQPLRLRKVLAECLAARTCRADFPATRQQSG